MEASFSCGTLSLLALQIVSTLVGGHASGILVRAVEVNGMVLYCVMLKVLPL